MKQFLIVITVVLFSIGAFGQYTQDSSLSKKDNPIVKAEIIIREKVVSFISKFT